jgi:hypothetical protein
LSNVAIRSTAGTNEAPGVVTDRDELENRGLRYALAPAGRRIVVTHESPVVICPTIPPGRSEKDCLDGVTPRNVRVPPALSTPCAVCTNIDSSVSSHSINVSLIINRQIPGDSLSTRTVDD